jgi:hypothetical protein
MLSFGYATTASALRRIGLPEPSSLATGFGRAETMPGNVFKGLENI